MSPSPPWPRSVTSGPPVTSPNFLPSALKSQIAPSFSVTRDLPSGKAAIAQGLSKVSK